MKNDNVLWALILGISIIISAFILSYTFIRIRSLDNTLNGYRFCKKKGYIRYSEMGRSFYKDCTC